MRLARAARAILAKSPTSDAYSDPETQTGPLAELATVNAENVRLRSELAAANEQLVERSDARAKTAGGEQARRRSAEAHLTQ